MEAGLGVAGSRVRELLERVVDAFGVDAEIRVHEDAEEVNAELDGTRRVLVRPSGTEPLVRVLAEAETPEAAEGLCARIADLVTRKLG